MLSQQKKEQYVHEITGLGSLPIFTVLVASVYLLGNVAFAYRLIAGFVLVTAIATGVRFFYFHPRPIQMRYRTLIGKLDASSFPSIHAARAGFLAYALSSQFPQLAPVFVVLSLGIAYSRVYLKKHWWTDVTAGLILGVAIGYALPI